MSPSLVQLYIFAIIIIVTYLIGPIRSGKVLDINEKLPELIEKHPEKGWLIKFYAPWCHHCQQLEPTYNNVAERVYSKYNDLIVGRVDCTKSGSLCGKYGVDSYPTIVYFDKDSQVKYRGDRSEQSMVAFSERLQGPTVNLARDCSELNQATNKHGLVILSTISYNTNEIRKEFEALAHTYKSTYWFYQYFGDCKNFCQDEGLYLLKRHLDKPIKFDLRQSDLDNQLDLKESIVKWLNRESFPVYGQISYRNIERALETDKLLVIAILYEYKPARKFSLTSREFHKSFEQIARERAKIDDEILFAWSSDMELIQYITITRVSTPNVIILKPDFSYHLMLSNVSNNGQDANNLDKLDVDWLDKLSKHEIGSLLARAKEDKLTYTGGSNYLFVILRYVMGNLNRFLNMYKANPLLVSLIFGFPGIIIIFVIYTTCFYDGPGCNKEEDDLGEEDNYSDDFGDEEDEETQGLISNGHLKQD